jgi:actin-related protein
MKCDVDVRKDLYGNIVMVCSSDLCLICEEPFKN